jgi:hypothetical protein
MRKILLLSILMSFGIVGYSENSTKKINSTENRMTNYYDTTFIIQHSTESLFNNSDFLIKRRESDTIYYQQFKIPSIDLKKIKSNNKGLNNIIFNKFL